MPDHSFDIVSEIDFQEVRNAFGQAEKEIGNRYDLKRVRAQVTLEGEELVLESADDFTLGQARDVVESKLFKRGVHLKSLRPGKIEPASGGRVRQRVAFQNGIPTETAKRIVAEIKKTKIRVQSAIQGDSVRVSGKSKDLLQEAISALRALDLDVPLHFTNYR